jgi:hypothetical protein
LDGEALTRRSHNSARAGNLCGMSGLRHPVKKLAERADARRWKCVEELMEPGEAPVDNSGGRALPDEPGLPGILGYLLLSDRAVYAFFPDDPRAKLPSPGRAWRIPFAVISHLAPDPREGSQAIRMQWRDEDENLQDLLFDLHVVRGDTPLNMQFWEALLQAVTEAHA